LEEKMTKIEAGGETGMPSFEELLDRSVAMHGHLCPGQVLGVRMAMRACRELGVADPEREKKRLIVFVEIDRCATDAIAAVTGCRLGKRTLKYVDYGKMAATFLDTQSGRAVRIAAREDSRANVRHYVAGDLPKYEAQQEAYKVMPDEELFVVQPVQIEVRAQDRPGPTVSRVLCDRCGEGINDAREVRVGDQVLCRACANGRYYRPAALPPALNQWGTMDLVRTLGEHIVPKNGHTVRPEVAAAAGVRGAG
jgi:formylmethanofuran dehydrogenase subunit E